MNSKSFPSRFLATIANFLKLFSILGFSLFLLIACNTNPLEPQNYSNDESAFKVSSKEVLSLCSNLSMPTNNSVKSGRVAVSKRKIKNLKNVPDEDGKDVFFVINYEEGGFLIMSADKRTSPVFAHSLTGEFKLDSKVFPSGLVSWLASTKDYIKAVRKNGDKFKVNEKAWKEETIEKIVGNSSSSSNSPKKSSRVSFVPCEPDAPCDPDGDGGGPCNDVLTVVHPLISTQWGQNEGYNDETPVTGCSNYSNGHAPTGCVATAMAQVMNFHRRPNRYNWDNMQRFNTSLTTLMKDIGVEVNMTYSCDGSSASTQNEVASSLTGDFQYSSAQYSPYNYSTVIYELNNSKPVILRGGSQSGWWIFSSYVDGHAWVCDGYQQYYFCEVGVSYLHLHMNWGWNGDWNGLYAFNNFNPNGFTFNYQRGMVYNIRP